MLSAYHGTPVAPRLPCLGAAPDPKLILPTTVSHHETPFLSLPNISCPPLPRVTTSGPRTIEQAIVVLCERRALLLLPP